MSIKASESILNRLGAWSKHLRLSSVLHTLRRTRVVLATSLTFVLVASCQLAEQLLLGDGSRSSLWIFASAATLLIEDLVAGRGDIDLSMRLPETEETEIADLQRSINTLLNKISAIVDLVINVSNSLATEASQLSTLKQSDP